MAARPASVFAEAEGDDSDDEGHTIAVDVWLSINRITNSSVIKTFEEKQITIEELLEFSETDLRSFCKDLQFDTLTTTRIIKGVTATKKEQNSIAAPAAPAAPTSNPTDINVIESSIIPQPPMIENMDGNPLQNIIQNMNENDGNDDENNLNEEPMNNDNKGQQGQVQHVIVSPQEHEAMESMYKRYDHTSTLQETIQKSFQHIDVATKSAKDDLNEKFLLLSEQMKLRQEELLNAIEELSQYKKKVLQEQNDQLKSYRIQISDV